MNGNYRDSGSSGGKDSEDDREPKTGISKQHGSHRHSEPISPSSSGGMVYTFKVRPIDEEEERFISETLDCKYIFQIHGIRDNVTLGDVRAKVIKKLGGDDDPSIDIVLFGKFVNGTFTLPDFLTVGELPPAWTKRAPSSSSSSPTSNGAPAVVEIAYRIVDTTNQPDDPPLDETFTSL